MSQANEPKNTPNKKKRPPPKNKTYPSKETMDKIWNLLNTDERAFTRLLYMMSGVNLCTVRERSDGRKKRYGADRHRKKQ